MPRFVHRHLLEQTVGDSAQFTDALGNAVTLVKPNINPYPNGSGHVTVIAEIGSRPPRSPTEVDADLLAARRRLSDLH